jgi:hypothetical protein
MLTAYLDESSDGNLWVIGGFVGNRQQWDAYCREWPIAIAPRHALHLRSMRLNAAEKKNGRGLEKLLLRAAQVPKMCRLRPFLGIVNVGEYRHLIKGTAESAALEGYMVALGNAVGALMRLVPRNERIEVVFETQSDYESRRDAFFEHMASVPEFITLGGKPIFAKWGSIPKGVLTEAADCLTYAFLQKCIDRNSYKAAITRPFLKSQRFELGKLPSYQMIEFIEDSSAKAGGFKRVDAERRRWVRRQLKANPPLPK